MTREAGLAATIEAACETMTSLAIYPLAFEADDTGARILSAMGEDALRTRSRGPYAPDNMPPEAVATIERIAFRWSFNPEKPDFTVEGGGQWPRLVMELPASRVWIRFVVPEDAPPIYQPAPNNIGPGSDIKMALGFVAKTLDAAGSALGAEPPMVVRLTFPDNPKYEAEMARLPAEWHHILMPVVPTIELDRRRCSRAQLAAHDEAIRSIAYSDQKIERLGRDGFTTRIASVCVRDSR